jgi:hypothetical protein
MRRLALLTLIAAPLLLSACSDGEEEPTLDVAASREGDCYRFAYEYCWGEHPRGYDDPAGVSCFEGADLGYWEGPDGYYSCQYAEVPTACVLGWRFMTVCAHD